MDEQASSQAEPSKGPQFEPQRRRLRDGTEVFLRPIQADDKAALQEGLSRVSVESRYRRFMAPVYELSDSQLKYLTEIDYNDHMAWVAFEAGDEPRGLGVARSIRLAKEPECAEVAVAIVDSHHGRGLGTILLTLVGLSALRAGVKSLRVYVHQENAPVLTMLKQMKVELSPDVGRLLKADVPLPKSPDDFPDNATGRLFKALAEDLSTLLHPIIGGESEKQRP